NGAGGMTTSWVTLCAGLASLNKKVVLVDTDIGLRNLDVVMGLENRIIYNLVDVIEGNCRVKQALIRDRHYPGLYLLPSAQTRDKSAVSPEQMIKLADTLKQTFDYIIMDCPAGIEQGFRNAIAAADRAIVVTTPEVSAIRDADRIIGLLESSGIRNIDLIINRIRMDMVKRGEMMSVEDVLDILSVNLIGAVPDEESVVIAANHGEPVLGSNSLSGAAYLNIARRILGETVPLLHLDEHVSLFHRIASLLGK
ncbi:MAG: septum site-determining protein MinD, partial [Lachnospiraceae bacterium]|nr:septum site-determining protein MinD [Lachnospiraceae bacterium]